MQAAAPGIYGCGRDCEKLGYAPVRQTGSHIRMKHLSDASKTPISIPNHKVLGKGLLRKFLRDADITVEKFIKVI